MATETPLSQGSNTASPLSNYSLDIDKARLENLKSMDELSKKLTERQGGVPWFKIAQGFLAPTRTGSFGESLGSAAGAMGDWQEKQEAQDIPLAKMKLELNNAKLGALNEIQANTLMAQALGTDLPTANQKIASGNLSQPELSRLMNYYPAIANADPKKAEILSKLFTMNVDKSKLSQGAQTNMVSAIDKLTSYPELLPSFIAQGILPQGFTLKDAQEAKDKMESSGKTSNLESGQVNALNPGQGGMPLGTTSGKPMSDTERTAYASAQAQIGDKRPEESLKDYHERIQKRAQSEITKEEERLKSGLRMGEESQRSELNVIQAQREARDKPFQDKHAALSQYDYGTVQLANAKAQELSSLVSKNPDVVGQLYKQGIFAQLGELAKSGVNTPWGSLNVNVENAINKSLPPEKQAIGRNIAQIISELNQNVMKTGKSIYGPQISTFDAEQMAKPGFQVGDPAQFITYLAGKTRIVNSFNGELAAAEQQYFEDHPKATTSSFFNINNKNSPYKSIIDRFNATYQDYQSKSPFIK
jgi:hypothetical protein